MPYQIVQYTSGEQGDGHADTLLLTSWMPYKSLKEKQKSPKTYIEIS